MIDRQIVREWVIGLGAFKGRNYEDYAHMVEPLTEFVFRNGFGKIETEEFNKLIQNILVVRSEITPTKIEPAITAKFLADQIRLWIEDIREALFSTRATPFSHIEDAEKWMNETEKRLDEWHEKAGEWIKQQNKWEAYWRSMSERYPKMMNVEGWRIEPAVDVEHPTQEELQKLTVAEHPIIEIMQHLESLNPGKPPEEDEWVKAYRVYLDNAIEIVKVTGFTMKSVEMYVLADVLPVLPPFGLAIVNEPHLLPSGISLKNRYAKVTVRGDMTFEDLRSLYRRIRRELGLKRSKHLTKENMQLYEIVTQRGNIPTERGAVEPFWESIRKEWNALNPRLRGRYKKQKTWRVTRITYERIVARLERRMIEKGGTK